MTRRFVYSAGAVVGGRYRVEAAIGHGGYATVYRAWRLTDGIRVALKVMHRHQRMSPSEVRRFEREANMVSRLQHRNVVVQLDFGRADHEVPFIVFELLHGRSLDAELKSDGPLSVRRVGQVAIQTLSALEAAHALHIAHRDIKPSNLFLTPKPNGADAHLRVLDFGIAKALMDEALGATRLTKRGQLLGTPAYMSPEQVRGGPIGLTCDLYSLGLVMAEALSGKKVVDVESDARALTVHIARGDHVLPAAAAATPFAAAIARAVKKAPEERYATASEMLLAVHAALECVPA